MNTLHEQWAISVRTVASNRLFLAIQFVSSSASLEFGSKVQERLCEEVGIPDEEAEGFWETKGMHIVEEAIRLKRATSVAGMKKSFLLQMNLYEGSVEDESFVPPDPSTFLPAELMKIIDIQNDFESLDVAQLLPFEYVNTIEEKRLRSNNDVDARLQYATFLHMFAKPVLGTRLFKRIISGRSSIDKYITPSLEAFIITAYVGNYEYWKQSHSFSQRDKSKTAAVLCKKLQPLFTEHRRGSGKFNGWSLEGVFFYNCVSLILRHQRKNATNTSEFSKLFYQLYLENNSPSKKRKLEFVVALNNLDCLGQVFRL